MTSRSLVHRRALNSISTTQSPFSLMTTSCSSSLSPVLATHTKTSLTSILTTLLASSCFKLYLRNKMTLNLSYSRLPRLSYYHPPLSILSESLIFNNNSNNASFLRNLALNFSRNLRPNASLSESESSGRLADSSVSELFDDEFVSHISVAKDAHQALHMIAERSGQNGGFVSASDGCRIILAALERNNPELALSAFYEMRASFEQEVTETGPFVERWKWSRPDIRVYTTLVQGLAASLRVSDALRIINNICQVGVSPAEEVPFGKVVRCPTCMIAVAVAQPQYGIQIVSCCKCRYQYELVSGNIINIESEEISLDIPAWTRGLRFLQIKNQSIPSAVHSIVVQTPSGMARTHRFATESVDLPAQEGERVTIALAAPSSVYREVGPFKFSPKAPNLYPGEPICLTNHKDGRESRLLRAPTKDGNLSLTNPSILLPLIAVLASGDAASGILNPNLPQLLPVAAVVSLALGATLNVVVFPKLGQIPERSADTIAIKQQLLSQYDTLQSRIKDLKEAAEKEVWMLARMCQLENKIFAVGEPSYRARKNRVKRVREGLENSLRGRIELIDSYARISSMIEIEVELSSDVLAAEAASNMENIAEQIQQIMELENLEERWKLQAEANDEAERLLSSQESQPLPTQQI